MLGAACVVSGVPRGATVEYGGVSDVAIGARVGSGVSDMPRGATVKYGGVSDVPKYAMAVSYICFWCTSDAVVWCGPLVCNGVLQ